MALYAYMQEVQRLMSDMKQEEINPSNIVGWINKARSQIAAEGECIRAITTIATVSASQIYQFASVTLGNAGAQGILNVRQITVTSGGATTFLDNMPWEWFNRYFICSTQGTGTPNTWSQYAQGTLGTVYVTPIPNAVQTMNWDAVLYPINLVDDTTAEAIPYPWTDAIPFYACALAYQSVQNQQAAAFMYNRFEEYAQRARTFATPGVMPRQFNQSFRRVPLNPMFAGSQQPPQGMESMLAAGGVGMGGGTAR